MTRHLVAALLFSGVALALASAEDWPQFRGPRHDGISMEKGLLTKWPDKGPKLVWSFKNAGLGFSSYALRDGKFYTLGTRGEDEIILVLDAAKGTELWTAKIDPIVNAPENGSWGDGPRSTPTLDGNLVFALGSQGTLICVDLTKNGAELWRTNLAKDHAGEMMTGWGYSESPLVDGDHVIVTPGGAKGLIAAFDKKTGKLVWQSSEVKHAAPYSTIMPADIHGVHQYVQMSYVDGTGGFVNGVAAKDGKLLWQMPIFKGHSYAAAAMPIVKDNFVYVSVGYSHGCHLFEFDKSFKATEKYTVKSQKVMKNTHGGVILIDDKLYGHSEGAGWVCQVFKTGKSDWNNKTEIATRSGSITAAEGLLYLYSEDGEVGLAQSTPDAMNLISSFNIPETSSFPKTRKTSQSARAWNYPVIANGHLFLRDCELIYCYDIRK
jgi:outer membrane protein assembly factor BamB